MSGVDKAMNKAQDLGGKAKEAVGKVTGDKSTEHEGKGDQAKSRTPSKNKSPRVQRVRARDCAVCRGRRGLAGWRAGVS